MKVINYLLGYKDMYIMQDNEMFHFSLDSVLLPNFITINKNIKKILDIGCGNAPIPLILSTKTDAKIIGVEIQKEVSELAQKSVSINNLNNQIKIVNYDIREYYKKIESDTFDKSQLVFRFISNDRVDFRKLAKELASIYKTRIELRQVGVRDKAREVGGCGICGRPLCCSGFLHDFDSVSINMAKT